MQHAIRHFLSPMMLSLLLVSLPLGAAQLIDPITKSIKQAGANVKLEPVATGLTAPNWGTSAPGDPDRLFVADQDGILWAIDLTTGNKVVFADLSGLLVPLGVAGSDTFDERGLLGVAFHPSYQDNGLLYTYTSEPATGAPDFNAPGAATANHESVITEWQVPSPADPTSVVDPLSRRVLLQIEEPNFNHNAGAINFGPDHQLYIALGDGGAADDQGAGHSPQGNGQNPANILGNILRIDTLGNNSANGEYGVPADNPFFPGGAGPFGGEAGCADGVCDEIFAWGFRNPFRVSFDKETGDLYAADVGQNDIEEVDVVVAGGNYGWRIKEGSFCFDANGDDPGFVTDDASCGPPDLIDPVAEYDHDEGIAIVGGFVYRGDDIPSLRGRYIFGDFSREFLANNGRLFFLSKKDIVRKNRIKTSKISELRLAGPDELGLSLLGFGQDANGELYVLGNMTGVPFGDTGIVLRIARGSNSNSDSSAAKVRNFRTHLRGRSQVPSPVDTRAQGQAIFQLNKDGTALEFTVIVANIENVIGAHIHNAPAGANGPIVLSMVPDTAGFLSDGPFIPDPGVTLNGILVQGTATVADLVGPLMGMSLDKLVDEILNGNTYVNVHTVQNRPGEIRGQIR